MQAKCFFRIFAATTGIVVAITIGLNAYVDYYGVLRPLSYQIHIGVTNERYVKMAYLLEGKNYTKYDTYLFGSSRVMKSDVRILSNTAYNLGSTAGMPEDCLFQLKLLIAAKAPVRTVYLGIDDFSYTRNYQKEVLQPISNHRYDPSLLERMRYQFFCLVYGELRKEAIFANAPLQDTTYTLVGTTGSLVIPEYVDQNIENAPEVYVTEEKFQKPTVFLEDKSEFEKSLACIKELKQVCDTNGIHLVLFFNPIHATTYMNTDMTRMHQFKTQLANITDFYDFSGLNNITTNNYFWYETSHARGFICDKILDIISGQKKIQTVPQFGVYVTKDNVEFYCQNDREARLKYKADHFQRIPELKMREKMVQRLYM